MSQIHDMGDAATRPGLSAPEGAPIPIAWQPIKTAPRDTYVLCWWSKEKIEGASWDWDEFEPSKRYWHYMQDGDAPSKPPKFWMPLPPEPKE